MYQTDFICTYKLMSDPSDQDELYRVQLIQAFDLEKWDDAKIQKQLQELYLLIKDTNEFKEIFSKAKKNENVNNLLVNFEHMIDSHDIDNIVFSILFNFSTFDLIHRVIIDFLRNNAIEEKHMTNLLNAL